MDRLTEGPCPESDLVRGHECRHERGHEGKEKCFKGAFGPSSGKTYCVGAIALIWRYFTLVSPAQTWPYQPGSRELETWHAHDKELQLSPLLHLGDSHLLYKKNFMSRKTCRRKFLWRSRNVMEGFSVKQCLLLDPDLCAELGKTKTFPL